MDDEKVSSLFSFKKSERWIFFDLREVILLDGCVTLDRTRYYPWGRFAVAFERLARICTYSVDKIVKYKFNHMNKKLNNNRLYGCFTTVNRNE